MQIKPISLHAPFNLSHLPINFMQWYAQTVVITSSCSTTRVSARETFTRSFSSWPTIKRDWRTHNQRWTPNRDERWLSCSFIVYTHFGRVKEWAGMARRYIAFMDCNTRAVYIGEIMFVPNVMIEDQMKSSINCWWYRWCIVRGFSKKRKESLTNWRDKNIP